MKKVMLSLVSVLALNGVVYANDTSKDVSTADVLKGTGLYIGAGYGYYDQSSGNKELESTVNSIMFDMGMAVHKYLDLETRYWLGVTDPDTYRGSVCGDYWSWGAYLKPKYPIANIAEVYALVGYAQNSIGFSNGAGSTFVDGFSWGIGASYLLNKNVSFAIDYIDMARHDSVSLDGYPQGYDINAYTINIGVNYKF